MKYINALLIVCLLGCSAFCGILWREKNELKQIATDLVIADLRVATSPQYNASEIVAARENGKIDGKIEALLMMQTSNEPIDDAFAQKVMDLAEMPKVKDFEQNSKFISLLSHAAYHKGLHTGLESAAQEKAEEYESGYHKAIEDFTCPYTGNINMPEKKIEVPSKKPDR